MTFSLEELNKLSDTPLDQIPELEGWVEPSEYPPLPQPGKYAGVIHQIHSIEETGEKNLIAKVDFQIQGGEFDGRLVTFQYLSSKMYQRAGNSTSQFFDITMAGIALNSTPKSNKEWATVLYNMQQQATRFGFQFDWQGKCYDCYKDKLTKLTNSSSYEEAKTKADKDQKNLAGEYSLKAKNGRDFPDAPSGGKKDFFECPDCHKEVRAQGKVNRYFRLGA